MSMVVVVVMMVVVVVVVKVMVGHWQNTPHPLPHLHSPTHALLTYRPPAHTREGMPVVVVVVVVVYGVGGGGWGHPTPQGVVCSFLRQGGEVSQRPSPPHPTFLPAHGVRRRLFHDYFPRDKLRWVSRRELEPRLSLCEEREKMIAHQSFIILLLLLSPTLGPLPPRTD
jgi:hypothetical protein